MSQSEMDAALDALEADNGATLETLDEEVAQEETVEEEAGEAAQEEPEAEGTEDPPPGYIGYEDWVASGKDPKKFRGEDAYSAQYDQIQETRETKAQLNTMNETLKHVAQVNEQWRNEQMEQMRVQAQAEVQQARDMSDVDAFAVAQEKLNKLNQPAPQQAPQENPVIAEFRQKNPMTDRASPRFNAEFNADVEGFYNSMVDDIGGNETF